MPTSTRSLDYIWAILLIIVVSSGIFTFLSIEKTLTPREAAIATSDALFPTGRSSIGESSSTEKKSIVDTDPKSDKSFSAIYAQHSDVIYGHVHMAKTGGTYLNGFLANNFERICGHKGYSYDAYQQNERYIKDHAPNQLLGQIENTRDRVKLETIKEIGFEDCDYISMEEKHKFWKHFNNFHNMTMELHLPCRDPIDHLMSQCNHRGHKFQCRQNMTDSELSQEMKQCYIFLDRYGNSLKNYENINLKCYNFRQQYTGYIDYITTKLQPRRLVSEYMKRETNHPRVKEEECIWKNEELQQRVQERLVAYIPYYRFCDQCIGSEDDITKGLV